KWSKNKYKNYKEIGQGGSGEISLATRKSDEKKVVIKKVSKEGDLFEKIGEFPKEYVIMKSLNHPKIAKVFDIEEDKDNFYIIMEHYAGGDLYSYMDLMEGVPQETVFHIAKQLIAALEWCHTRGVVHRDIKLENIFVKESEDEEGNLN